MRGSDLKSLVCILSGSYDCLCKFAIPVSRLIWQGKTGMPNPEQKNPKLRKSKVVSRCLVVKTWFYRLWVLFCEDYSSRVVNFEERFFSNVKWKRLRGKVIVQKKGRGKCLKIKLRCLNAGAEVESNGWS